MRSETRIDSRGGVSPGDYPPFDPPPDPGGAPDGFSEYAVVRDAFVERREQFGHFLDDAEAADRQLAVSMAARARRIDELREVSVSIATLESAEDAARTAALRAGRGTESGWSIQNRAKTELSTEIAMALNLSKNTARTLVAESETFVANLPLTLAALEEGRIRYEHARVIATTAWTLPVEALAGFEAELVPLASRMILSVFRARVLADRERLHTESMEERHEKAAAFRNVAVEFGEDGMGYLTLHDSNEVLAAIYNRVTAMALPKAKNDPRTLAQRRADVATEILLKGDLCTTDNSDADGSGSGDTAGGVSGASGKRLGHGIVAQVQVEIPVLTLLGIDTTPATLEGKTPIDPVTARKLVADAPGFFRLLTDPITGSIVAFDDTYRHFPASLRRAVRLIDGKCTGPWCDATPQESDGHHPDEWQNSHNTSLGNAALLCQPDHRLIHNTRWTMQKLPNGDKQWTSPCGRIRTITAHRRLSPAFVEALIPDKTNGPDKPISGPPATDSWYTAPTEGEVMPF